MPLSNEDRARIREEESERVLARRDMARKAYWKAAFRGIGAAVLIFSAIAWFWSH
jgi:hypothetical protein